MAKKIKPPRDKEAEKAAEAKEAELKAQEAEKKAEAEAAAVQDEFQAKGVEAVDWVQDNRSAVLGFLGAVVIAGLGYGIYTVVDKSNNTQASAAWVEALKIWEAPISDTDFNTNDDVKPYPTAEEKYQAARSAFEGVVAKHGKRGGGVLSSLYVGHSAMKLGQYDVATNAYQAFLDGVRDNDRLRFAGYSGLAAAKEATGDTAGAVAALEALVALADDADEDAALLNLGRLYQKQGDSDKARARLDKLVLNYPSSSLKTRADELLATLGPAPVKPETATP